MMEMTAEDTNSIHRIDNHLCRRLICLPITEAFANTALHGMHGKVQHGDKCSLPSSIGKLIFGRPYEVPWLFEVTPVNPVPLQLLPLMTLTLLLLLIPL
jgi:hypothetical protein